MLSLSHSKQKHNYNLIQLLCSRGPAAHTRPSRGAHPLGLLFARASLSLTAGGFLELLLRIAFRGARLDPSSVDDALVMLLRVMNDSEGQSEGRQKMFASESRRSSTAVRPFVFFGAV